MLTYKNFNKILKHFIIFSLKISKIDFKFSSLLDFFVWQISLTRIIADRMNEVILKINQRHDISEADKLHNGFRILD
jgi:hypothetical protein